MKVLVTGASGFIGQHLVQHLVADGHTVRVLVRKANTSLPVGVVERVEGDVADPQATRAAVKGIDSIFHLAAARDRWGLTESVYHRANVAGTHCLLVAAAEVSVQRFVYCSSAGVARYPGNLEADERLPYTEPDSQVAYHRTKAQAERDVLAMAQTGQVPALVVRPVITYGPGDETGMVTKLLGRLARGTFFPVGDGRNHLHLVYVADLVEGMMLARERGQVGQVYILSGQQPTTVRELLAAACAELGKGPPGRGYMPAGVARHLASMVEFIWSTAGRQPPITRDAVATMTVDRGFSHARAHRELGYQPKVSYREGLAETAVWARSVGLLV